MNHDIDELLKTTIDTVKSVYDDTFHFNKKDTYSIEYLNDNNRELKSVLDKEIEKILDILLPFKIPILSEESGNHNISTNSSLKFIIDPLDGTVNYTRQISISSISIALYDNNVPLFGVLITIPNGNIVWGGAKIGSYLNNKKIHVSSISKINRAILCTGFPASYDFNDENMYEFNKNAKKFFKIRMLGSASISLLQVAKGSAECYYEKH